MTRRTWTSLKGLLLSAGALLSAPGASASWIDSDFYCRVYGCVVVHDGFSFDVYDNFVFATGGTVPAGDRMIPWTGNPFQGAGGVNPVITGTRNEGFHTVPLEDQSVLLGIDTNGDGIPDRLPNDGNSNGFLDAGDTLDPFNVSLSTNLVAADTSAQRSFYLSSRTDFYLTAEARLIGPTDNFNTANLLNRVAFDYGVTRQGVDDGMAFGANARTGNYIRSWSFATIFVCAMPLTYRHNRCGSTMFMDLPTTTCPWAMVICNMSSNSTSIIGNQALPAAARFRRPATPSRQYSCP